MGSNRNKNSTHKNRLEWLTEEIITLKRQVRQAERRYHKSKNKDHKEIYIDLKKHLQKASKCGKIQVCK